MTIEPQQRPDGTPIIGRTPLASRSDSYGAVLEALRAAQKTSIGAPAYSRFINRPLGRLIAAQAFRWRMEPNGVTAVSAALSFAGIIVVALVGPTWWTGVVVALCLIVGYAFDSADGQLARLGGGGTASGEWLDHVVDAAKIGSLHLAVLISAHRFLGISAGWLLVPIGFTVVATVLFFAMILNDQLRRQQEARSGRAIVRGSTSPLRSLLVIPTDYGLLCIAFVVLGFHGIFFIVYTALFVANAAFMLLALPKWFRDMKTLG